MRRLPPLVLVLTLVLAFSCGPGLLLNVATEVFTDGSVRRRVEVIGVPGQDSSSGSRVEDLVTVADRKAWRTVEEVSTATRNVLSIEGSFAAGERIPPALAHRSENGLLPDRNDVEVRAEDLVILQLWSYRETYGDPYGPGEYDAALERMLDQLWDVLQTEVRREFGARVETPAAEALVRHELRSFLLHHGRDLVRAVLSGDDDSAAAVERLKPLRLPVTPVRGKGFADAELNLLFEAARSRFAAALSTPERTISPEELRFWPALQDGEWIKGGAFDLEADANKDLAETVNAYLEVANGFFDSNRFRFHYRLDLPGRLLRTNGVAAGSAARWFFRNTDVAAEPSVMEATSVVLDDAALRRLGARRTFEAHQLLEIVDILGPSDPKGEVKQGLRAAIESKDIALLRDKEHYGELGVELADLLDPSAPMR